MARTMIVTTLRAGADARRRMLSALARGERYAGVFFHSDGVGAACIAAESNAWRTLATRHRVPLALCSASAARRGIEPDAAPGGFTLAGIGYLAELLEAGGPIDVADDA